MPDTIIVRTDPCWLAESDLDVGYVVSTVAARRAAASTQTNEFAWYGGQQFVYRLDAVERRGGRS